MAEIILKGLPVERLPFEPAGIANGLTLAAQKEESWEKSVEMERIAGNLITLPVEEFKALDEP